MKQPLFKLEQKGSDCNNTMDSNKKCRRNFVDRISELPECIMHHILSFLSMKDVTRTRVLNKRWNSVWTSFPILDFEVSSFGVKRDLNHESLEEYENFVDCTLHKLCTGKSLIKKFKLFMTTITGWRFESHVNKWIGQFTKYQVRELDLHIQTSGFIPVRYSVPAITIFANKSLTSLNLRGWEFKQPFPKEYIKCCSLKILSLEDTYVSEMMIEFLISSFPLIEVIVLKECWGFRKLSVSGLLELKTVKVFSHESLESIDIELPSLQSFYSCFERIFALHKTNVSVLCQSLRNLTLIRAHVTTQMFPDLDSNLPFLEYLFLASCDVPQRVKISSRRLKRLTLRDCMKLEEIEIDTPDLHSFQFVGYTLPLFSSLNAPCQLEVLLYLVARPDALWHLKLKEFLKKANQGKVLTLAIMSSEIIKYKSMEGVKEISLLGPKAPAQLSLHMHSLSLCFPALFDRFLLNYCPNTLLIVSGSTSENKFEKNLSEKLVDRTDPYCFSSRYLESWCHMVDVKIANFEGTEDERPLCWNTLVEAMPTLSEGQKFCFFLEWAIRAHDGKTKT